MEETKPAVTNNNTKKRLAVVVFLLIAVIGAVTLYFYLAYKATHIATDDAFVDGHVHTIASKVSGTVSEIYVKDNQEVKKGDPLLEMDHADYDAKVNEAASGLGAERAKISEIEARIDSAKQQLTEKKAVMQAARANLELQNANLAQAETDVRRAENLYKRDAVSKERYEKMLTGHKVTLAQVKVAEEQLKQAERAVEAQRAAVNQAEATKVSQSSVVRQKEAVLKTAQLNYGYTKIYSPSDGYVTKKSVERGNQIQVGQPLMAVVALEDIYITANYKETQLEKIKPGQKVNIKVDTYPGKTFKGTVESIMAGTGSVFSLFPPENATGSFVKVVQRVPVKILPDKDTDKKHVLRVGMSVEPTILVDK